VRAFVITGPFSAEVRDVAEPVARPGEVVVAVERAGVCGTDVEFFSGEMAYLKTGEASYPIRIGHEWSGTVSAVGDGVDPTWLGRRVTGDTMLGCQRCERCRRRPPYLCADRQEIGIRHGWPGALAEKLPVPAFALHPLPSTVDATLGALVEPGANALRAVRAADLKPGQRLLVVGPGTIGLLVALIADSYGFQTHLLGPAPVGTLDRGDRTPGRLRRRHRRVQRGRGPGARGRPRRPRRPDRLHRTLGGAEPGRHPSHRAQGRHRRRYPRRILRADGHHRALRVRRRQPATAGGRHRRPRRRGRRPGRPARPVVGARPQGPHRSGRHG
jgi:hypothetical protein